MLNLVLHDSPVAIDTVVMYSGLLFMIFPLIKVLYRARAVYRNFAKGGGANLGYGKKRGG